MSAAVSRGAKCSANANARAAAFAHLAPIRAQLVERLSRGAYSAQEQKEWAEMPAYLRDLAIVMAGVEGRDSESSLLAFTGTERCALMQCLALLKRDIRGVVALAYGGGGLDLAGAGQ